MAPYKGRYTLGEFWHEMNQSEQWASYAKANPDESAKIADLYEKKIAEKPFILPPDLAKTFYGRAMIYALCTLSAR